MPSISGGLASDESGGWDYRGGVSGTVTVTGRVVGCTAMTGASPGSLVINSGQVIPIPANTTLVLQPRAMLKGTVVFVFDTTTSYFLEMLAA